MPTNPLDQSSTSSRREFLKTSTTTAAGLLAGPAILGTKSSAASPGDELRVGLIGCGGRGSEAAMNALRGDQNTVLTAIGDLYADTIQTKLGFMRRDERLGPRIKVEKKNQFVGLDSYKAVLDSGVDVVILATPPGFRPQHMKAAVEAGKHMFVEKPMATDAPGVRSLIESVAKARERKLGVCAGFCWRYSSPQRALYERIHNGEIGHVTTMYATYNTGFLWDRSSPDDVTPLQKQLRMWYYYTWLSGDHLCEQAIHAIDWMQWVKKDVVPIKCVAHGGRQVRTGLLLHANALNADHFGRLARAVRDRGYRFITLEEALRDEAYSLPDAYVGRWGISWLHHWELTAGRERSPSPDPPAWLTQAYEALGR